MTTSLAHAVFHQTEPATLIPLLFQTSFPFLALAGRAGMTETPQPARLTEEAHADASNWQVAHSTESRTCTDAPCGNTAALVGVDQFLVKADTLTTLVSAHNIGHEVQGVASRVGHGLGRGRQGLAGSVDGGAVEV